MRSHVILGLQVNFRHSDRSRGRLGGRGQHLCARVCVFPSARLGVRADRTGSDRREKKASFGGGARQEVRVRPQRCACVRACVEGWKRVSPEEQQRRTDGADMAHVGNGAAAEEVEEAEEVSVRRSRQARSDPEPQRRAGTGFSPPLTSLCFLYCLYSSFRVFIPPFYAFISLLCLCPFIVFIPLSLFLFSLRPCSLSSVRQ